MSEQKEPPTVVMGAKPSKDEQIELDKPVLDMDDAERAAARQKVLDDLAKQAAAGNSNSIDIVIESKEFEGTITMRRPSMDEQREIGVRAAKYLQGVSGVDLRTDNLALFFGTFDVLVDWNSAPKWFEPRKMYDYELLEYVYGRWTKWVQNFPGFVPPKQDGNSGTSEVKT